MSFSIESIQPVLQWLHAHSHFALVLTFLIAFAESLVVVGSIIPGSVTMTAVGILAGSGILRIDLSILSATLGAIAGDSASFMFGYYFSEQLSRMWPFKRYPQWLIYGKNFFDRHGKKSVFIGRFTGPLRAVIPVIAGMMHMNQWHFYLANIISGFLWSVFYMIPGILIGTAASELSPESAVRFCMILLGILFTIWIFAIILKWLLIKLNLIMSHRLHHFWLATSKTQCLTKLIQFITPQQEIQHAKTAIWVIALLTSIILFIILAWYVFYSPELQAANLAIHYASQSLKTLSFDKFFVCINQLGHPFVLGSLMMIVLANASIARQWHLLYYWLSLMLWTGILMGFCHLIIHNIYPLNFFAISDHHSFPAVGVTYATTIVLSLYFFIQQYSAAAWKTWFLSCLTAILLGYGLSTVYLDESWLSDVIGGYLLGLTVFTAHWIFFRTRPKKALSYSIRVFIYTLTATLLISFSMSCIMNYRHDIQTHQLRFTEYLITDEQWWNQYETLLPRFQKNRFGRADSPFNIQYSGNLQNLEQTLTKSGWKSQHETFYQSIVKKLTNHPMGHLVPILTPLYLNRKPALIMRYYQINAKRIFILRLWRSNYHLVGKNNPIWIGHIHTYAMLNHNFKKQRLITTFPNFLIDSLNNQHYQLKTVMPIQNNKHLLPKQTPVILIRESLERTELPH